VFGECAAQPIGSENTSGLLTVFGFFHLEVAAESLVTNVSYPKPPLGDVGRLIIVVPFSSLWMTMTTSSSANVRFSLFTEFENSHR
jgi:hypothetical protein